eukprot:COSAG06_NODE_21193_length_766_cov_1.283358_3_plen_53_part_01
MNACLYYSEAGHVQSKSAAGSSLVCMMPPSPVPYAALDAQKQDFVLLPPPYEH